MTIQWFLNNSAHIIPGGGRSILYKDRKLISLLLLNNKNIVGGARSEQNIFRGVGANKLGSTVL